MFKCPIILMGKAECIKENCKWWLPEYKDCNQNVMAVASDRMSQAMAAMATVAKKEMEKCDS